MSKEIVSIPLSCIQRVEIKVTNCRKTMAQVKTETGAAYILNGGMWNADGSPCPLLKVNGKNLSSFPWSAYGYSWDDGPDIRLSLLHTQRNFIAVTPLIHAGEPIQKLSYAYAQGGKRGRSAMGIKDGSLCLYCSSDGSTDAKTPEKLRDELHALGWESAIMLDGGGSSQCDFEGQQIKAGRKVHNWICVYTKENKEEKPVGSKYQVTPSIGVNIRSGPGTGYGKVGAYPCGTVVEVTTTQNGWGQTAKGWISMDYVQALEPVQRVTDTGLGIQMDYIPAGRANRPGGSNPGTYITIHETGNAAKGADAAAHANYLKGDAAAKAMVSWHYTVDDHGIVQHLPDQETAYHAGDGASGTGNSKSIGVEICVNAGGDFNKAKANAASLVRLLMKEHGIPLANVVQHNHWTVKDCPYTIRHTAGGWEAFLALCEGRGEVVSELDTDVDTLAAAGILTAADYWKGGDYSAANVQALIGKMADYVREGK